MTAVGSRIIGAMTIILVLIAPILASSVHALKNGGSGYQHPYPADVKVGDIVFGHSDKTDFIIPGFWTHTGMIAYYDDNIGDWIVVEANPDGGIMLTPLRDFMARYDTVALGRVDTDDATRSAAVDFALQRLGLPYDYFWPIKQVYGDSYYCSELVWAAYKAVGGPDVDANPGWSWTYAYGVAPQEVYEDSDVTIIYYNSV